MKTIYFTIFFSVIASLNYAQDTITKFNNDKIIAKILEISPTEIKYKKFNFLDGPTYVEKKSEVKMVVYSNGLKEEFKQEPAPKIEIKVPDNNDYYVGGPTESNKIDMISSGKFRQKNKYMNERDVQNIMIQSKDKKIVALVTDAKHAKGMQYLGFAGIPLGIAAGVLLIGSAVNMSYSGNLDNTYLTGSAVCAIAAIACPVMAISFKMKRNASNKAAVKMYNEKF